MNIRGTDFVVYYVNDLEKAIEFYRNILGLKNEIFNKEWNWAEFSIPPTTLVLFGAYPGAPLKSGKGGTGVSLSVEDLQDSEKELKEKGITLEWGPIELSECFVGMISDPDGNPIFLHQRKDGSWG